MHLLLPVDGPPVLLARHREEDVSGGVLEAHFIVPCPVGPAAHHRPVVQVVALTGLPKRAHLLRAEKSSVGGREEGRLGGSGALSWAQSTRRGAEEGAGGQGGGTWLGLGLCWDLGGCGCHWWGARRSW